MYPSQIIVTLLLLLLCPAMEANLSKQTIAKKTRNHLLLSKTSLRSSIQQHNWLSRQTVARNDIASREAKTSEPDSAYSDGNQAASETVNVKSAQNTQDY